MPRNSSIIRRLGNGASAPKGKNGKFLRVSVHKTTRKVEKVQPNNWTPYGNRLFTRLYPDGLALKTRRKKQQPTMVTVVDIPAEEPQAKVEEEKEDCCICYSEIPKARTTLECGHSFCTKCILTGFNGTIHALCVELLFPKPPANEDYAEILIWDLGLLLKALIDHK